MTAAVSFTVEGATVLVNLAPGTAVADITPADRSALAALVKAVRDTTPKPTARRCPVCGRHITLTTDGRRYTRHTDKARHHCPMSRQEVIT